MLSFFPRDVLDEILNLIESVVFLHTLAKNLSLPVCGLFGCSLTQCKVPGPSNQAIVTPTHSVDSSNNILDALQNTLDC